MSNTSSTSKAAAALGSVRSPAKTAAARTNGQLGGRPRIIWTVSQDGGKSVSGGYMGRRAKELAMRESGGRSVGMTEDAFRAAYPHLPRVTLD